MSLGTQAKPYGKLLDYEQFIDHQIQRTRSRIKLTDIMTASLMLLVAFLAVLFLEVVFDHVFGLPLLLRRIVLTAGLTGACMFAAMRVAMPFMRKINAIYAAKTIEDADPAFKNSLINYLELRGGRGQVSKAIMATLEARAVSDLTQVEVDHVVNQQRLMRTFYALSGVIVIFCLYAAFTPKSILDSTRRAFLADLVRPTNTKLMNIKPGEDPDLSKVVAGEHVGFSVDVQGMRPRQVLLHFSVDGGKFFAVREFSAGRHLYDPWQVTITSVQQSMEYYLTGGDSESLRYHLKVLPAPTIMSISHDLAFPGYTKMPGRANIEGGTVEAIEGTQVTVHAKTNMPAATATLIMTGKDPIQMGIDADDPTVLTGKFQVQPKSGSYIINFRTTGSQFNPSPVTYDINSIPDRPPTARFVQPDKPAIKVPANVKVDLVATGNDDHGVKDATLLVIVGREPPSSKDLLEGKEPQPEFKAVETLDLEKLGLKPGSTIQYKLTVRDNKEPSPNRMETALQLIEVIDPVSPSEKKKLEDSQKNQDQAEPSPRDEETAPDQPPQSGESKPDAQQPGGAQEPAKDVGNANQPNATPKQPDGGSANENPPNKEGTGNGENQPQLTPKEQRDTEALLRQAMRNKQNPPGKQGGSPAPQPKNGTDPKQSGNPEPSAPGKNDRPNDGSDSSPDKVKQPSKMQEPGQANPPGSSPKTGQERNNDPTNQVKRAEPSNDPANPDTSQTKNDGQDAKQGKTGRPNQSRTGESGDKTKTKAGESPGEANPAEQSKDKPPGAAGQDQATPPPSRNDSKDPSTSTKNEKNGAKKPDSSPESNGNPQAGTPEKKESDGGNKSPSESTKQAGEPKSKADKNPTSKDDRSDSTTNPTGTRKRSDGTDPFGRDRTSKQNESGKGEQSDMSRPDARDDKPKSDERSDSTSKSATKNGQPKDMSRENKADQDANRSKDTTKDASERRPGNEPSASKDDKQSSRTGQDNAEPKAGKRGSNDEKSPDNQPKASDGGDANKSADSSKDMPKNGGEGSTKDAAKKNASTAKSKGGDSKDSEEQAKSSEGGDQGKPGTKGTTQGSQAAKKQAGQSKPGDQAKTARETPKSGPRSAEKGMQGTRKEKDTDADQKSPSGSDEAKPGESRPKNGKPRPGDPKNSGESGKPEDRDPDKAQESAAPRDARPDSTEKMKDGRTAPKDARTEEGDTSRNPSKDRQTDPETKGRDQGKPADNGENAKAANDADDRQPPDRARRDAPSRPTPKTGERPAPSRDDPRADHEANDRAKRSDDPANENRPDDQRPKSRDPADRDTQTGQRRPDPRSDISKAKPQSSKTDRDDGATPSSKSAAHDQDQVKLTEKAQPSDDDSASSERPTPGKTPRSDQAKKPAASQAPDPKKDAARDPESRMKRTDERQPEREPEQSRPNTPKNEKQQSDEPQENERPKDAKAADSRPKASSAEQQKADGNEKSAGAGKQKGQSGSENSDSQSPVSDSHKSSGGSAESKDGSHPGGSSPSSKTGQPSSEGSESQKSGGEGGESSKGSKPSASPPSSKGESSPSGSESSKSGGDNKSSKPSSSGGEQSGQPEQGGQSGKGSEPHQGGGSGDRQSSQGGGGGPGAGNRSGETAKDDSTPSPQAQEPADPGKGLVAPEGQQQSELVLKQIHEVLNNPAAAKDLEQREGVTRSDVEQLGRKFEKLKSAPAGPGREIQVKPGEQTATQPAPNLPGLDKTTFSTKNVRNRGSMAHDEVRDNLEDVRFKPPSELRSRFQAYTNKLSKVVDQKSATKPSPKKAE